MPRPSPQTDRIRWIVQLLSSAPRESFTLSQIARHLMVSKATCTPAVAALTDAGWLVRHPQQKTYRLGPALVEIGRAAEQASPMDGLVPALLELCTEAGTACLALEVSDRDLVVAEILDWSGPRAAWAGMRRGHRIRVAAPLGAVLVAWENEQLVDAWATNGGTADPRAATKLVSALAGVRRRGFVVELQDHLQYELFQLLERMRDIGPSPLGDQVDRVSQLAQQRLADLEYLVDNIDPDEIYEPVSINAPVFDRYGDVQLVVCLVDFPRRVAGSEMLRFGKLVRVCASGLTAALHGTLPESWPTDI